MTESSILQQIQGTWILESIYYKNSENIKIDYYGPNPKGILMYDQFGFMNAQLGFSDRSQLKKMNPEDDKLKISSYDTYMAYYGRYYEQELGVIIHDVIGCTQPAWVGEKIIRYVKTENNILYITTPETIINNTKTRLEVYWSKAK